MSPRTWRRVLASCVAGLTLAAQAGCSSGGDDAATDDIAAARPVPVTLKAVESRAVERTIPATGTLRGWEDVTVGAKTTGRVERILHDMGDLVKPGEVLVELETIDATLAAEQAKKDLEAELAKLGLNVLPGPGYDVSAVPLVVQARVALDQARRELTRVRGLYQRNSTSVQELQDSEDKERSAAASLDAAEVSARAILAKAQALKVAVDVAEQKLDDLIIRCPTPTNPGTDSPAGTLYGITQRMVSEGQILQPGASVMRMVVGNPLRLWVQVSERYVDEIQPRQTARVSVSAFPDREFPGTVERINPAIDELSRTFQIEIQVQNGEGVLRPGGFAEAAIVTRQEDQAIVVPIESIVEFAGNTKVFVLAGDTVRDVPVEKGVSGRGWVEVRGDLAPGDQVVITGQSKLADGTLVEVRDPTQAIEAAQARARGRAQPSEPTRHTPLARDQSFRSG